MHWRDSKANVFWDSGSTLSFITNQLAKKLKLKGKSIQLSMVTVGGKITTLESKQYEIGLVDKAGGHVKIDVIGIERISSPIVPTDLATAAKILGAQPESISRPTSGEIDILIGIQYAAYHPERIKSVGHLTLYENRFGRAIAGAHRDIKDTTE